MKQRQMRRRAVWQRDRLPRLLRAATSQIKRLPTLITTGEHQAGMDMEVAVARLQTLSTIRPKLNLTDSTSQTESKPRTR
jgi:hypothetical protein